MRYLLGKAILSVCLVIFCPLSAGGKSVYDNVEKRGSPYLPDALPPKEKEPPDPSKKTGKNPPTSYGFVYMQDGYEVVDKGGRGTFERIYDKQYGTLLASYDRHLYGIYNDRINLAWGLGMGVGYNQGNPKFESGSDKSDAIFRLYTLLLDVSLAGEVRPVDFLKLMLKAGPSFMGLYRSRSDFSADERGKNIRQVGVGGFAHAAVKIGLGRLFPSWGRYLHREYKIHGLFLNTGVRYQYYSGFKHSRIERVNGLSYVMGLSFEFF